MQRRERRRRALELVSLGTAALFLHVTLWVAVPRVASAAPPPRGTTTPRVLLVPLQKSDDVRSQVVVQRISEYLKTLLSMSGRMELLDESALAAPIAEEPAAPPTASPEIEAADDLLWRGKDQIEKRKYRDAVKTLRGALEAYESHYRKLRDYDKIADALLQLSVAYYRAGYEDNGEETLTRVIVMRPDLVLDPRQFSTGVAESVEAIRTRLKRSSTGTVQVTSTAPGNVYLDGVLKGAAPQTLTGLFPGRHYVQVIADAHEIWAERFTTPRSGKTHEIAATPKAIEGAVPARPAAKMSDLTDPVARGLVHTRDFPETATTAAQAADAQYVLMGFVSKGSEGYILSPFLHQAASQTTVELDEVCFDAELSDLQVKLLVLEDNLTAALAELPADKRISRRPACYDRKPAAPPVVAAVPTPPPTTPATPTPPPTTPATLPPTTPETPPATPPAAAVLAPSAPVYDPNAPIYDPTAPVGSGGSTGSDEAWYQKWWVWTIVGVVVVGGAVTAGFLLAPEESKPGEFSVDVQW